MSTVPTAREMGRAPKSSMKRPPPKAATKSHVMRARCPKRADTRSDTTPPDGRDTRLSRPEMEAMPPPRVWLMLKWFCRKVGRLGGKGGGGVGGRVGDAHGRGAAQAAGHSSGPGAVTNGLRPSPNPSPSPLCPPTPAHLEEFGQHVVHSDLDTKRCAVHRHQHKGAVVQDGGPPGGPALKEWWRAGGWAGGRVGGWAGGRVGGWAGGRAGGGAGWRVGNGRWVVGGGARAPGRERRRPRCPTHSSPPTHPTPH